MKKVLFLFAVLALSSLLLFSCGTNDEKSPSSATDSPEATAEETKNPLGESIKTLAPETTAEPKNYMKDPSFYEPDLSKYFAYKKFDAPQGDLREIVYGHMLTMAQYEWVAGTSWTTKKEAGGSSLDHLKYTEGKTYYGIPYTDTKCGLYTFEDFVIDGVFTPDSNYYEKIIGNHCSASMGIAYQQIIDLPYHGGLKEGPYRNGQISISNNLTVPLDESGTKIYKSQKILDANGVEAMYEAYATLGRGDILYKMVDPAGHTRMVSKVEVQRNLSGKIVPARSYVYCIEQTSAWADGQQNSTWFVDRRYAFDTLATTLFTPFTLDIFHEENPKIYDAYMMVSDDNDAESLLKMLKGTIESTFPINYVRATITDKDGKIVKEVLKTELHNNYGAGYKVNLRDMTYTLSADKLPAGTYTFKLRTSIARGAWEVENFEFTIS